MSEGKRPGGLTALAVLNFVFGGLGVLGLLAVFALIGVAQEAIDAAEAAGGGDALAGYEGPGMGSIYFGLILSVISVTLLITSGVGYLQQKVFLGRKLGTAYAIVSIGSSIVGIVLLKSGFGIGTIIGLIYPCLTLFLLNTTFKDDFYR